MHLKYSGRNCGKNGPAHDLYMLQNLLVHRMTAMDTVLQKRFCKIVTVKRENEEPVSKIHSYPQKEK